MKYKFFLSLLLSATMALGSINPFDLTGGLDVYGSVQSSVLLLPVLAVFIISTLFDKKCMGMFYQIRPLFILLLLMGLCFFMGDLMYGTPSVNIYLLFKYFFAILSFCCIFLFYSTYQDTVKLGLLFFCAIISIIVIGYFVGIFRPFAFFSNGRLILFGENPNSTSSRFGVGAILMLCLACYSDYRKWIKIPLVVCYLFTILYLVLSGSRGSFAFVLLFSLIIAWPYVKRHFFVTVLLVSVAIAFSMSYLSSFNFALFDRFEMLKEGNPRTQLMKNALMIYEDNPIFGVGINGYDLEKIARNMDHHDSHCIVTSILAMGGTAAIICFIGFMFKLLNYVKMGYKHISFFLALFIFVVSLKTGGAFTWILMWYVYAISMVLSNFQEGFLFKETTGLSD